MIPVTKPFLPNPALYKQYIDEVFERNWLTNNGPLVNDLELKLKNYLFLKHLLLVSNGTIALQIAIKALELKGEIITTPFSYVASTSSIVWQGCTPVFVDILSDKLTIDPAKIEAAITPETSAILAAHIYGIPCEIDEIQKIADKHGLKVIYDGAHAFGVKYKGKSVFEYGDISTCSFHATKIFHTVEGGMVATKNPELLKKMALFRNFGHEGFDQYNGVGINAKNSEFHAAMGLSVLPEIAKILESRKKQSLLYREMLANLDVQFLAEQDVEEYNHAYFPIVFKTEKDMLKSQKRLGDVGVGCRRYFFPSLNKLDYTVGVCTISEDISTRILCLPLYHTLTQLENRIRQHFVIQLVMLIVFTIGSQLLTSSHRVCL
jgi:dTDP-4-amino-4,6-dideoxygalactose transaminase